MSGLSFISVGMFALAVTLQLLMIYMLPRSQGFTNLWSTITVIATIDIAMWIYARLTADGVPLSILVPFSSAIIPVVSILMGVLLYGESASLPKLALLVTATGLIGFASCIK
jgi:multidrug transporter EmrE-like cation transporter